MGGEGAGVGVGSCEDLLEGNYCDCFEEKMDGALGWCRKWLFLGIKWRPCVEKPDTSLVWKCRLAALEINYITS